MTTTLNTYAPGRLSAERVGSIRQHGGYLPALFNDDWLNSLFGEYNKAFEVPNAVYPYNVVQVRNSEQEVTQYEVEVALAGVGKEGIDVKVREGKLHINISKDKEEANDTITYLKRGISQRKGSMTFNLDEKVNSKNITSSYKDGLLRVVIPVVQPETIDVDVNVE
jgi:HSP20 family molecular chaperone IbpA